jgi:hypothetical protein
LTVSSSIISEVNEEDGNAHRQDLNDDDSIISKQILERKDRVKIMD